MQGGKAHSRRLDAADNYKKRHLPPLLRLARRGVLLGSFLEVRQRLFPTFPRLAGDAAAADNSDRDGNGDEKV